VRILLVSHEASRTGAPRVAVLVARSLVEQGHSVQILSRARGPLLEDFAAIAPTSVEFLDRVRRRLWSFWALRSIAYLVDTVLAMATLIRRRPDLVYVNSTAAAIYLRPAQWLRRRVVLHVHESGTVAEPFLSTAQAPQRLDGITVVACSPSVQADLQRLIDKPAAAIKMLPSVPDDAEVVRLSAEPLNRPYQAEELIVGCCGTVEHRKGADQWVAAAREVRKSMPGRQVRFVWIGEIAQPVQTDDEAGIEFCGPTSNPYAHMRRFDVATLPSRDDPFPLVVLEAMLLGTPVVAFDVGGVARQIGDAGVIIPAGDVAGFARQVVRLLIDHDTRINLGAAAQARVNTLYSTRAFAAALSDLVSEADFGSQRTAALRRS
jgi:glycosyltransferase involved in cell wall biosynthesis